MPWGFLLHPFFAVLSLHVYPVDLTASGNIVCIGRQRTTLVPGPWSSSSPTVSMGYPPAFDLCLLMTCLRALLEHYVRNVMQYRQYKLKIYI